MRQSDSYDPRTWRDPDAQYGRNSAWHGPALPNSRGGWLALGLSAALLIGGAGVAWATREAPAPEQSRK